MKKSYLLLPIALLALASCNKATDDVTPPSGASELVAAVTTLEKATEYKVTSDSVIKSEVTQMGIAMKTTTTSYSEEVFKGNDYSMDMSKVVSVSRTEMKISEICETFKMTVEQAEKNVVPYFVDMMYPDDYKFDVENDVFWLESDRSPMDIGTVYLHFGVDGEQSYYGEFVDGKYVYGSYVPNYYIDESMFEMSLYTDVINKNLNKATKTDDGYVLDLSSNPIEINVSKVTKLTLSWTDSEYKIRIDGTMTERGKEYVCYTESVISNLGNTGLVIPEFTILCPCNHEKTVLCWYSEEGHVETCAYCRKYLSTTPVAHVHSEKHDECLVCEYDRISEESYLGEANLFEDGQQIFRLFINKAGTVYTSYPNENNRYDLAYNHQYTLEERVPGFDFEDELNSIRGDFQYYAEDKVLTVVEILSPEKLENYCRAEYNLKIYVFRNAEVELTEEQQAIIDGDETGYYAAQVYWEAMGEPTKWSEVTEKFGTEFQVIEVSNLVHVHSYDKGTQYDIDECNYVTISTCTVCGQSPYVLKNEHHDFVDTIITPEWGNNEEYFYYIGICSHCGEESYAAYGFLKESAKSHTGVIDLHVYDPDTGREYYSYSSTVPHIDSDGDGKCDFCGEDMPVMIY